MFEEGLLNLRQGLNMVIMQIASGLVFLATIMSGEPPSMDRDDFLWKRYEMGSQTDGDGYFGHKDVMASIMTGKMSIREYVIGGLDRELRNRLFRAMVEATLQGYYICINAGYRGPERQALIKAGIFASVNGSFHGGAPNKRGDGHGLAADLVSCDQSGKTHNERWKASLPVWFWLDVEGPKYGVGRPYMQCDPPHVGPTDGVEYRVKHPIALARAKLSKDKTECYKPPKRSGNKKKKRRR